MIVLGASTLLFAFLPDEAQPGAQALIRDCALGRIALRAPTLMRYEVCNTVLKAERQGRINQSEAEKIPDNPSCLRSFVVTASHSASEARIFL